MVEAEGATRWTTSLPAGEAGRCCVEGRSSAMRHPRCPLLFRCRVPTTGLALALLALAGCGGRGPYPVEGKIVVKGDPFPVKDLQGYTVMFQSQTEPVVSASGTVEADGT